EEKRYTGVLTANNYGRKSIGEARVEGGFLMANPIFEGDMLNLSGIIAQDSRMYYGRIDYDAPVNTSGTRVGLSYSAFRYDVDVEEIGFPGGETLGGNGYNIVLSASHPIQRSTRNNTTIIVDGRSSTTDENGSLALRDKNTINLLEVFVNYDHLYSNYAKTSIFGGLATNFKSIRDQLDRKSQKAKLTLDIRHYQPFLKNWFIIGRAQGAYSPDPLVDVERYRIGGQGSVRAFPSAELAGDKGGVLSLDIGINFIVSGKLVLTPKVFADAGKVYRYNEFGFASLKSSESLAGYGAGLSAVYAKNHIFDLEVVTPTTDRDSSDGRDTRFWLNYRGIF
ncbi:MAG: ShlB/FhaC/HecB family hemolysin secretion/activation protein, partial [Proteobacteria bacterium]|nr:ShlB/FhaC/HecB family hemolysin secretion/activation protein [Pseudomonadota bacterium]